MSDSIVDCIVIGAGLSGLSAADKLIKSGHSVLVLEARDRVGGKTWSVNLEGLSCRVDVGAAWINDTNQSEVYALANELGLQLIIQNTSGDVVQEDINGGLSTFEYGQAPKDLGEEDAVEDMLALRQSFEDSCQQIDIRNYQQRDEDYDQMSLRSWVESNSTTKTALASASVWTRAMLGLEPQEISALHFLDYCKSGGGLLTMRKDTRGGGQYLRFVEGSQGLSKGLASRLPVGSLLLNHPVSHITQDKSNNYDASTITVTTHSIPPKTFKAKRLILTLPTPLYKSITLEPSLPHDKQSFSHNTIAGHTNKVILLYKTPWWRRANLCGLLQSFTGPITVTRDSSVDQVGQYSLTCFLVGEYGRQLSQVPQQERFDAVIAHVERVFTPFCKKKGVTVEKPIAKVEHEWAKDLYSGGCPVPCTPIGILTEYGHALREPFGGIHFAGTETSWEWKGYMDGAIRSGKRAAEEVIAALHT